MTSPLKHARVEDPADAPRKPDGEPLGELVYFPIRGRSEVIRLACVLGGRTWTEHTFEWSKEKPTSGSAELPFGQWPVWRYTTRDGEKRTLSQMDAILRHVGRATGASGADRDADALVDMILGGVESLRSKYVALVYSDDFDVDKYAQAHVARESATARNGGAHLAFLDAVVERARKRGWTWAAGTSKPSIADVHLFEITELHARLLPGGEAKLREAYPALLALYDDFRALPQIAAWIASERRHKNPNNNARG